MDPEEIEKDFFIKSGNIVKVSKDNIKKKYEKDEEKDEEKKKRIRKKKKNLKRMKIIKKILSFILNQLKKKKVNIKDNL